MSVLDNQTKANQSVALYGGGGGGGGGPTPSFSTITVEPNADFNWSGSLNFQGLGGGYVSIVSSVALDGTTPATLINMVSPNNTAEAWIGLGNDNKMFISSGGIVFNGGSLASISTLTASNVNLAEVNAAPFVNGNTVIKVSPTQVVYAPPGGGNSAAITTIATLPGHSYRVEFPVKIQGWNASDGLSNTYAPLPGDNLYIAPLGNVDGSPAPVFAQFQMSAVSSMNNDEESFVSGVFRTTGGGTTAIFANSIGATYSTSVECGQAVYITDLGAI